MKCETSALTRLYLDAELAGDAATIGDREAHYLSHVLRLRKGHSLIVFNGRGRERVAMIKLLTRREAAVSLGESVTPQPASSLELTLIQALVKAEAMDAIVQKATELGVTTIVVTRTEFSVIRLDEERGARRLQQWERIAATACEQSGRHYLPAIRLAPDLESAAGMPQAAGLKLALHNRAPPRLRQSPHPTPVVTLAVGPEGGFGAQDVAVLSRAGFEFTGLGSRILRADTAATVACGLAQMLWGDFELDLD
jgi:16S rRNA (uracil1498-N3)-methyltransferase